MMQLGLHHQLLSNIEEDPVVEYITCMATLTGHVIQETAKGKLCPLFCSDLWSYWVQVSCWNEPIVFFVPGCGGCGFQWGLLMASWGWFSSIWPFWDFKWMLEINRHLRSQARVGNHPHCGSIVKLLQLWQIGLASWTISSWSFSF